MKVSQFVVVFAAALVGNANAAFKGTDEEFIKVISEGKIPEGLFPEEDGLLSDDQSLRRLREPRSVGQRCGRNTPCEDGLECVAAGIIRMCLPVSCMEGVVQQFVTKHGMEDYPQTVLEGTGFLGRNIMNETTAKQGWGAVATGAANLIRSDFRQSLVANMQNNPPNMTELLVNVLEQCPQAASKTGVTLMLGLHYELSAVVPKWFNNFYFAVGTGDLYLDADGDADGSFNFKFNASTGIYTDCCAGVGPDVGVEFGLTAGFFLSGTINDLEQCAFMFDCDAGVGSSTGLAAGVTNPGCVGKFFFTQSMGLGAGIGFSGCGTVKIADLPIGS